MELGIFIDGYGNYAMASDRLNAWFGDQLIGAWSWSPASEQRFYYAETWAGTPGAFPLSRSLPIPTDLRALTGSAVQHYFANLLPDSDSIRRRLGTRFKVTSGRDQDLLAEIGRDCIGAIQLLPEGMIPPVSDRAERIPLNDAQIAAFLRQLTEDPVNLRSVQDGRVRVALSGAQEKTALVWADDRWNLPRGATPTTHIFKLSMGLVGNMQADMRSSVPNEWLCLKLMAALGFSVADAQMASFEDQRVLIVERFDRARGTDKSQILRLPQEDFCQATATAPEHKYESDGGPGIRQCLEVLEDSQDSQRDKLCFVLANLAFWLLAATDGHAKNFSLAIQPGGAYRLTSLYDVLSAWPVIGHSADRIPVHRASLAMCLRGKHAHRKLLEIQARHWKALAGETGHAEAWLKMVQLVETVPTALGRVGGALPEGFPMDVFDAIQAGMLGQCKRFLQGAQ
jgi:serine/threonine-protein kinase HipA